MRYTVLTFHCIVLNCTFAIKLFKHLSVGSKDDGSERLVLAKLMRHNAQFLNYILPISHFANYCRSETKMNIRNCFFQAV